MVRRHTSSSPVSVKAALYARVSTDDGRQTVGNQVRQLRELAVAREFEIFREYTDEETGASPSRTAFLALLRDARLRRFRVLLITDPRLKRALLYGFRKRRKSYASAGNLPEAVCIEASNVPSARKYVLSMDEYLTLFRDSSLA